MFLLPEVLCSSDFFQRLQSQLLRSYPPIPGRVAREPIFSNFLIIAFTELIDLYARRLLGVAILNANNMFALQWYLLQTSAIIIPIMIFIIL